MRRTTRPPLVTASCALVVATTVGALVTMPRPAQRRADVRVAAVAAPTPT